jgi:hypothetical protein
MTTTIPPVSPVAAGVSQRVADALASFGDSTDKDVLVYLRRQFTGR